MKCPICSSTFPSKASYCPYCGHKISEEDRDAYIDKMIDNPESAEEPDFETDYEPIVVQQGSMFAGFILGVLFGFLGVFIAIMTRGMKTKRGSGIGLITHLSLGIVIFAAYFFTHMWWGMSH